MGLGTRRFNGSRMEGHEGAARRFRTLRRFHDRSLFEPLARPQLPMPVQCSMREERWRAPPRALTRVARPIVRDDDPFRRRSVRFVVASASREHSSRARALARERSGDHVRALRGGRLVSRSRLREHSLFRDHFFAGGRFSSCEVMWLHVGTRTFGATVTTCRRRTTRVTVDVREKFPRTLFGCSKTASVPGRGNG